MSVERTDAKVDPRADQDGTLNDHRSRRTRLWLNWSLALLTVVGAGIVMAVAGGAVMSTAACSDRVCPNLGPSGISFNEVFYGAPALAALTIAVSFFTAKRRWGITIPVSVLAIMVAAAAVVTATVVICHGDGTTGWPAGRDHLFGSRGMIWRLGSAVN